MDLSASFKEAKCTLDRPHVSPEVREVGHVVMCLVGVPRPPMLTFCIKELVRGITHRVQGSHYQVKENRGQAKQR